MSEALPVLYSVSDVMDRMPGVSERALRQRIRALGCYTKVGNTMLLTEGDVQYLIQKGRPCRSISTNEEASGTTEVQLPGWHWAIDKDCDGFVHHPTAYDSQTGYGGHCSIGLTPALALCTAVVKAMMENEE